MAGKRGQKLWGEAVSRAVHRRNEAVEGNPRYLDIIADRLVQMAADGDVQAIKEIGDRLDGKAKQETDGNMNLSGSLEIVKRIAR